MSLDTFLNQTAPSTKEIDEGVVNNVNTPDLDASELLSMQKKVDALRKKAETGEDLTKEELQLVVVYARATITREAKASEKVKKKVGRRRKIAPKRKTLAQKGEELAAKLL